MKTKKNKLTLNRETVRNLAPQNLAAVVGGGSNTCIQQCGPTEVNSCTSCVCTVGATCD
jgi:hypothetical protein